MTQPNDPHETPDPWSLFEQTYRAWETAAAPLFESMLGSASTFAPAGKVLGLVTRAQRKQQRFLRDWWGGFGLATQQDQVRTLRAIDELQSRLIDLEEKLEDLEAARGASTDGA